jgi:hypothetical protein
MAEGYLAAPHNMATFTRSLLWRIGWRVLTG